MKKLKSLFILVFVFSLSVGSLPLNAEVATTTTPAVTTTDSDVVFESGDLDLTLVPALKFGTHKISEATEFALETPDAQVHVTDYRGTGLGWNLTAKLGTFTSPKGETLEGAYISSKGLTPSTNLGNTSGTPLVGNDLTIVSGGSAVNIIQAGEDQGAGVWTLLFDGANTKLNTFAGTSDTGKATAVMTWTLSVLP